jgi:hypothetical protein
MKLTGSPSVSSDDRLDQRFVVQKALDLEPSRRRGCQSQPRLGSRDAA